MSSKNIVSHLALLSANLIFGLNYPIAKSLMPDNFQPAQIILFRSGIAFVVFYILNKIFISEHVEKRDIFRLILCGLFGVTINQFMFFAGLNYTTAVDASIIMVINPILVLILSYFIIHERILFSKIIGIGVGLFGASIIIIYGKVAGHAENRILGNFFVFINAISYALYLIIIKPLTVKYKPLTLMSWTFFFGFLFMSPAFSFAFSNFEFSTIPNKIWLSLIYVVLASTILAYLLISFSLQKLSPVAVSFYIYIQPVIASIISIILYNDKISLVQIFAASLIFFGVYLVNLQENSFLEKKFSFLKRKQNQ